MSTAPITSTRSTLADGGFVDNVGPFFFAHSCHYCQVDDADDARIMACNCFASGLRFWDIHDITNIKEMAYFKPQAQGTKPLAGSQYANTNTTPGFVRMYDWATSKPSFPKDRGADAGDVDNCQDNGFMVISLYSKVTVNPSSIAVDTNKATTLVATVDGAAKTAGVSWSVTPSTGATVTSGGVFTATTGDLPGDRHQPRRQDQERRGERDREFGRLQLDRRPIHRAARNRGSDRLAAVAAEDVTRSVDGGSPRRPWCVLEAGDRVGVGALPGCGLRTVLSSSGPGESVVQRAIRCRPSGPTPRVADATIDATRLAPRSPTGH